MFMNRITLIALFLLVMSFSACAQKGYRIEVTIEDLKDTTLLLGYHFGEKKFVADTAYIDSKGVAVFQGDSALQGGMYIVILPQRTYFDILLGDNQHFSLKTNSERMMEDLEFKNSPENTAFANYQRFMGEMQKQMGELQQQMQSIVGDEEKEQEIAEKIKKLDSEVKEYWEKIIANNPKWFFANMIRAIKPLEMPDFDVPETASNPDSLRWIMSYLYNQKHYFDNVDLTDERLIRTPFFQSRVDSYFDRFLLPIPDTIMLYADKLIEQTRGNQKMFQFMLSHLFSKFQNSSIMGMDAVFVHLAEKYYLSGDAKWINDEMRNRIADRVADLKPNLIGALAPNLRMTDFNNKVHELHKINARVTIIYFWEPGCSHCKKVTPELLQIYSKFKSKGLEVFGIYTQGEMDKWKEYVSKNNLTWINVWDPNRVTNYHKLYDIYSTPIIYILDKDKKIIAKRIGVESVERFLNEELKN